MGWPFCFCGNPNNNVLPTLLILYTLKMVYTKQSWIVVMHFICFICCFICLSTPCDVRAGPHFIQIILMSVLEGCHTPFHPFLVSFILWHPCLTLPLIKFLKYSTCCADAQVGAQTCWGPTPTTQGYFSFLSMMKIWPTKNEAQHDPWESMANTLCSSKKLVHHKWGWWPEHQLCHSWVWQCVCTSVYANLCYVFFQPKRFVGNAFHSLLSEELTFFLSKKLVGNKLHTLLSVMLTFHCFHPTKPQPQFIND